MRIERGACVSACGACFNMQSTTLYFILNCLINEPLNYATLISTLKYVKETFSRMYPNTRTHTYIRYTYIQKGHLYCTILWVNLYVDVFS